MTAHLSRPVPRLTSGPADPVKLAAWQSCSGLARIVEPSCRDSLIRAEAFRPAGSARPEEAFQLCCTSTLGA
jgi:hypothetical protein